MNSFGEVVAHAKTLTFDCYGTLIDWREGVTRAFQAMFGPGVAQRLDQLFRLYVEVEAQVEGEAYRTYRQVLGEVSRRLATQMALPLPREREDTLAETLPTWPAFPDTDDALGRLKHGYRLGVLSNIDRDLFAVTVRQFAVTFDFVVTAQDVRAYKPSHPHFQRLLERYGGRERTVHVARSLYHDGVPAGQLGIPFVWINRYADKNETSVRPLAEFPNLCSLADAIGA